jgi:hypothetical protein
MTERDRSDDDAPLNGKSKPRPLLADAVARATQGEASEIVTPEEQDAERILSILMEIDRRVEDVIELSDLQTAAKLVMGAVARVFGGYENLQAILADASSSMLTEPLQEVFRLKITLEDAPCDIHRVIEIPDCTLEYLHAAIQAAMGWGDHHLHLFEAGDEVYGPRPVDDDSSIDWRLEESCLLSDVIEQEAIDELNYIYDMGDRWSHRIEVLSRTPVGDRPGTPKCLEGKGACPPEDCGGVDGYALLLRRKREGKLVDDEVIPADFDSAFFDLDAANADLKKLKWGRFH